MPVEQQLTYAAVIKWIGGEPLSMGDFDRILRLLAQTPIEINQPQVDEVQAKYAMLRQTLAERYVNVRK